VPVALRVNRADAVVPAGSHRMTGVPTPFGIDEHDLGAVAAAALASPGLDVVGFHLHAVSNTLDAAGFAGFAADAVAWARQTADRYGIALREVNIGGGIGLDYDGDRVFDLAALCVFASILAHGLTDTPGVAWIARRAEQPAPEPSGTPTPPGDDAPGGTRSAAAAAGEGRRGDPA
jgi:diaminopimelate decarboxylase